MKINPVVKKMKEKIESDYWRVYVGDIPEKNNCKPLPSLYSDLRAAVSELVEKLPFRRDRLQTRFFELGKLTSYMRIDEK